MPASSVRRQLPTGTGVVNQSVLEMGRRRGGRAVRRQVEAVVQPSTGKPKPFDRYKIGYADSNDGNDERGFSRRARAKPAWAL